MVVRQGTGKPCARWGLRLIAGDSYFDLRTPPVKSAKLGAPELSLLEGKVKPAMRIKS